MPFDQLYVFFSKMSIWIFCPLFDFFFFFGYWDIWTVYIFWQLIPCWSICLQIFSLILCGFLLFMITFAVQKLLSLITCFFFLFIFIILGGGLKKILLQFMSVSVPPFFSSKSFIVSSLIFRSLTYFEFIFICDIRECSNFILLCAAVQFSQHHLLKRLCFLLSSFLLPLS